LGNFFDSFYDLAEPRLSCVSNITFIKNVISVIRISKNEAE